MVSSFLFAAVTPAVSMMNEVGRLGRQLLIVF
jgi:hypothetical protein